MQGMQVFTGTYDAWGGFASRYLERIRDEYGKVPVWVWGIEDVEQKQAVSGNIDRGVSSSLTRLTRTCLEKKAPPKHQYRSIAQ